MNLVTTTQELQIVLGEAKTTSDCDITASFGDFDGNNFTLGLNALHSNGTTPVVVVPAPAVSVQRQVKEIRLVNRDTVPHNVTLQLFDGTNTWVVPTSPTATPVASGGAFVYTPEAGVCCTSGGGGGGGVSAVVAGSNLNVGAGPGGTITTSGTLNLQNSPTISVTASLPMVVNANTAVPALVNPNQLSLVASDTKGGGPAEFNLFGYRGNGGSVVGLASGGQLSAPTAVLADTILTSFDGCGYDGSSMSGPRVTMAGYTTQNWSPSSQPTGVAFSVTAVGATTQSLPAMSILDSNIVTIGTNVAAGAENLQVVGGASVDNLVLGSGTATAVAGATTLNTQNGQVTSEALIGATTYTLTLSNALILSTSTVTLVLTNSASLPVSLLSLTIAAGSATITVGMAALTGTVVFGFAVFN